MDENIKKYNFDNFNTNANILIHNHIYVDMCNIICFIIFFFQDFQNIFMIFWQFCCNKINWRLHWYFPICMNPMIDTRINLGIFNLSNLKVRQFIIVPLCI